MILLLIKSILKKILVNFKKTDGLMALMMKHYSKLQI